MISSLIGNSDVFPILRHWDFFNHAGVCPLPKPAGDALRMYAQQAQEMAYIDTGWYRAIEKLRDLSARLIHAHSEEIAFVKNTSEGLATVANGIDWQKGERIVTTAVEYPANIYPWMDVAARFGVELVMVGEKDVNAGRAVPMEDLLREIQHPQTRLVALSHVEFASGQRHDIATIGKICREQGKLFCVDAIQSLGVLPVDVRAMNIDYLSADGHKWLLGPEGAGIFYCRRELLAKTRPLIVGWMNVINQEEYGSYDFTLKSDARRFECGSYTVATLLSLRAAMELLLQVGIESIAQRMHIMTDFLISGLESKGYDIISPRDNDQWSGIVSFSSSRHDHAQIVRMLRDERKSEIALREGRLRCSAHFYNTQEQLERLIAHLPGH
jgi:cysteine desulfurase / selenocysteine lyase